MFRAADALSSGSHRFFSAFGDAAALTQEVERLGKENAALAAENTALLERAGAVTGLSETGIAAGVVARPPESPYDTLVVSAGTRVGVGEGMEAFGPGGVPIGIVTSVLRDFSRVTLFSAPRLTVPAWVGAEKVPLSLIGTGAGTFQASLPRLSGVSVGDTVFVSGPGALPSGAVVRIDADTSSSAVTLRVQSSVNPFSLTWVTLRATGSAFANSLSWATTTAPKP